jgi:hypothetical protein
MARSTSTSADVHRGGGLLITTTGVLTTILVLTWSHAAASTSAAIVSMSNQPNPLAASTPTSVVVQPCTLNTPLVDASPSIGFASSSCRRRRVHSRRTPNSDDCLKSSHCNVVHSLHGPSMTMMLQQKFVADTGFS